MMKERVKKVLALQHWLGLSASRIMLDLCVQVRAHGSGSTSLSLYLCLLASFNVQQARLAGLHFTRGAIFFSFSSTNGSIDGVKAVLVNCLAKGLHLCIMHA
jgi:hypothetical protein